MAGKAESIAPLWAQLQKHLALDPPTELHGGTYLGQIQRDVKAPTSLLENQARKWAELFQDDRRGVHDVENAGPEGINAHGHRTAKRAKQLEEELELPISDPSFLLDPQNGKNILS